MGACISVQEEAIFVEERNNPYKNEGNDERGTKPPALRFSQKLCNRPRRVLKDPSGENIFEKYTFGKELGRGEFGITYVCIDQRTLEIFACKTISKQRLRTEIDVEDVRREVEIMRQLPIHPNIVRYKEVFEDKEAVYLVMELCEGGELFDRIVAKRHFTERGAALLTKTILEVVKVCHEHGVIHRDLKPENFLYASPDENAPLKAIDFGLSIFFEPGQRFSEIVGSPYYMAPEVLRRNYGAEIDVWSAGIILYILLCGVPPFWADSEEAIAHTIIKGEINFSRDPWPKISEDAKDLVRGMLDQNPYTRMTIDEVLAHHWIQNVNKVSDVSLGERVGTKIKQFSLMNKFKKRVLRVVADVMPDDQVDEIKTIFHMMDTDKSGSLSFEELKEGLKMIGHPVPDSDVMLLMDAADGNGTLTCDEFVTMAVHIKRMGTDEHLHQAFLHFDMNRTGYIEFEELRDCLSDDNPGPNHDQFVQDIMFDADLDKDGRICYGEFKAMMNSGMDWRMASRQYSRAMLTALSMRLFKENSSSNNSLTNVCKVVSSAS